MRENGNSATGNRPINTGTAICSVDQGGLGQVEMTTATAPKTGTNSPMIKLMAMAPRK